MKSVFALVLFQNSKVRRFAFELKMQDKSTFLLAADSEAEMDEWIGTLNKILHSSFEQAMQEKRNGDLHDGAPLCLFYFNSLTSCLLAAQLCLHVFIRLPRSVCLTPSLLMLAAPAGSFSSLAPHGIIYLEENLSCLINNFVINIFLM